MRIDTSVVIPLGKKFLNELKTKKTCIISTPIQKVAHKLSEEQNVL